MDDNRISGISYCGYHGSAPYGGSTYFRSVGVACDVDLRFPDRLQTYVYCDDLLGAAPFGFASQYPLMAQGYSISSGRGSLEVSLLGSSFSRLWEDKAVMDVRVKNSATGCGLIIIWQLSLRRWRSVDASRLSCCILSFLASLSPLGLSEADQSAQNVRSFVPIAPNGLQLPRVARQGRLSGR